MAQPQLPFEHEQPELPFEPSIDEPFEKAMQRRQDWGLSGGSVRQVGPDPEVLARLLSGRKTPKEYLEGY